MTDYRKSPEEAMLRESDMALIATGLGNQTRPGWLPSKLFEYLGCRIPILAIAARGKWRELFVKLKAVM